MKRREGIAVMLAMTLALAGCAEDPSGGPERHDVPEINKKLWKEIPYESAVEDLQGQWTEMKKQLEESTQK